MQRKFSHDQLEFAVYYLSVGQSFEEQPVNSVAFRDGKHGNLLMLLYLGIMLFAGDYQP